MCLSLISELPDPRKTRTIQYGFKVFRQDIGGILYSEYMVRTDRKGYPIPIQRGQWLTACHAKDKRINTVAGYGSRYPIGFHVLPTRNAAQRWRQTSGSAMHYEVLPVRYRYVVARGRQRGLPVVVAQQIYIPTERQLAAWKEKAKGARHVSR